MEKVKKRLHRRLYSHLLEAGQPERRSGAGPATVQREEVSIEMGSLFTFVALIAIIGIAAGGFYLYTRTRSDTPFFTPRVKRLAFIERAHLDGGRKLLLVRRDDVEHLILVGGPIDLVVETGIKPKELANGAAADDGLSEAVRRAFEVSPAWMRPDVTFPAAGAGTAAGPSLSLSPDTRETAEKYGEDRLEPTPLQKVQAAKEA